ncbi:MAG: SIMPL domain-containing protein [Bacteroidetes bacterium]|nr:SIMPL domain-containing protein [Bacteroidota bacterium]
MIKKILLGICLAIATFTATAQQTAANPFPKTISVSGSAEMEVIPDQIYVNIVLREYQKKNEPKKDLETLKTNFMESCRSIGLPDSIISIASYTGFNNYYWLRKDRKKTPDLFASITYQVKFSNSKQMDDLIEKLDDEATQSFEIVNTSHSKMSEYRKQLKILAVKAAKDKGIYLTEAIGEKLGPAITVNEPDESNLQIARISNNVYSQTRLENNVRYDAGDKTVEIDFKRIKLRYEVSVVFALQ